MKYSKSKRSYPKKSSKTVKVAKSKTVRPSIKKYVLKTIAKHQENKMRQNGGNSALQPTNGAGYQTNCIMPLTPYYEAGLPPALNLDISQGTGVSNRIGNSIRTKSGYLRFVIYPTPYNVNTNPIPRPVLVTQWIIKLKSGVTDSSAIVQQTLINNWFKDQNSSFGVQNSIGDVVAKSNPDYINVLFRKTYKLGYASATGTGVQVGSQSFANNDYKFNHVVKMDITKYQRKHIRYSDNNLQPLTSTTWMCFTVAYANGDPMPSTHVPAIINWEHDYQFEDA